MSDSQSINSLASVFEKANRNNILISTTIELLTKCNWRCVHCFLPAHDHDGLPKEIIFDILAQLRKLGCFEITFTGGEIFYRDDAMDIIRRARDMGFSVVLFTNVSLLDEDMIKELSQLYISQVSCTIFSLHKGIHDSITGVKGSLKKAMENIMLMKKYNLDLQIKTILMKSNYNSFDQLKVFCEENGFRYKADLTILRKNDGNCEPQKYSLSQEQLELMLPDVDKLAGYASKQRGQDDYVCPSLKSSLFIDSQGNIYPCNRLFVKLGSIFESSIADIWSNSEKLAELKNVKWGDVKGCIKCEYNKYCVRCPGDALLEEGDMFSKSSLACAIAKTRDKLCNNAL